MPPTQRYVRRRVGQSRGGLRRPTRISPSQFFKLMIRSTILDRKLLLPEEFSAEFGVELSTVATLIAPNGCTWRVGIKKSSKNNMIWFLDGWHEFVEYYSIDFGYSLVFRYEGNSKFRVMIFHNVTGCQIEYPSDDQSSDAESDFINQNDEDTDEDSEERADIFNAKPFTSNIGSSKTIRKCFSKRSIGRPSFGSPKLGNSYEKTRSQRCELDQSSQSEMDRINILRKGKQKMSEKTSQRNILVTQEDGEDFFVPKSLRHKNKNRRFAKPRENKKAIQAATMNKLNNPSFMIIIKPHNKTYVYVPADFARKYLPNSSELITLEAPNGEQRVVTSNGYPSSCSKRLEKGWGRFLRENYLEEGDVCVFELINSKIIVLKVWMYRVADYAGR